MNDDTAFEQTPEQRSAIGKLIRFCITNKLVVGLFVLAVVLTGLVVAPFDWDVGGMTRYPVPVDAIPDIGYEPELAQAAFQDQGKRLQFDVIEWAKKKGLIDAS